MLLAIGMAVGALTMQTLDGHEIMMSNYGERRGTLVLFMSSRSPELKELIGSILRIHEKYRRQEVLFVGLCANDSETFEELMSFCLRRGVNFPVYRDPGGVIAKRFGARVTPEAFLLDAEGVLRFRGGFQSPEAAKKTESAIRNVLKGRPIGESTVPATGTPIEESGNDGPTDDPIEPIIYSSELVFDKVPWVADHHCSTLAEAPNGDLLCVWFGGSYECADDQVLFLARRKKGARTWETPEVLTRGVYLHPPGNAVVFRVSPTRMMVLYDRMDEARPLRRGRWRGGQLMCRHSDDNGCTWSEDAEVKMGVGGIRNAPITLRTGELMVPISNPKPCFLITRNGGVTWEVSGFIDTGGQPTAVQRNDGSLLCLLRSQPKILQSESHDLGKTWTAAVPSPFLCPGAGVAMCRLNNGHLLLVFNDSSLDHTPLSIVRSIDEGVTWEKPVQLEPNSGEYSYPCVVQTSDGNIHVSYTFLRFSIKHVEFNERWLELSASPSTN